MRTITLYRYQVVCDDCGKAAGEPQETVELALGDAVSEDFQNYGPGDGTCENAVWRCPSCALAYERAMDEKLGAFERVEDDLPF